MDEDKQRLSLIVGYFESGFTTNDMSFVLEEQHGITLSPRQLKRVLRKYQLSKRNYSSPIEAVDFIQRQLSMSGRLHGYRIMYQRCLQAGIGVRMEDVREVLRILDPVGVEIRQARRLDRRSYFAKGPNFIWHLDGYDKLKPYGLCIHGCICGYSRKLIWLNVHTTNNNPRIVGGYFIEAIQECGGLPCLVRGDFGTENVNVRDFQKFLRRTHTDAQANSPYIEGSSTTNQRIESWWGFLRRECTQFWMDTLKELQEIGEFSGDFLDKNLIQFCFMAVIQDELDVISGIWNSHSIRPSRNPRVPSGRPSQMYQFPSLWGAEDQLRVVSQDDIRACLPECEFRTPVPCDDDIYHLCIDMMHRDNLGEMPSSAMEASYLYRALRTAITRML